MQNALLFPSRCHFILFVNFINVFIYFFLLQKIIWKHVPSNAVFLIRRTLQAKSEYYGVLCV
jgi:hypothetical protein